MCNDDLADGIGVDQPDVEDEWDQVIIKDYWLLVEIDWY